MSLDTPHLVAAWSRAAGHWGRVLLLSLVVAFAACGSNNEGQQQTTQPTTGTEGAGTAAPPEANAPQTEQVAENTETTPVEEVSEIEESSETATPANATPPLKLASRAVEPRAAPNSAFKEGTHYQRLVPTQPTSVRAGQVEVVEVFWYGCPHCFQLEAKLEGWRADDRRGKAAYVEFLRIPATWNEVTTFHARVFYTAELLGKLEQLHTPIFREIQVNGNGLGSMDKAKAFFVAQGVAAADFDRTFKSFSVEAKLQNATVLMRRYKVPSVPYFVVNGKYATSVSSAGGEDQLLQLLTELAAREQSGG